MYVDAEHLKKWIEDELAVLVNKNISSLFGKYLNGQTWSTSKLTIEFDHFQHAKVNLSTVDESTLVKKLEFLLLVKTIKYSFL